MDPKQAKDQVIRLDQFRKASEDTRLLKSESKKELIKRASTPFLLKAAEGFLDRSKIKPSMVKHYPNMLFNQVLPEFGAKLPINSCPALEQVVKQLDDPQTN